MQSSAVSLHNASFGAGDFFVISRVQQKPVLLIIENE